VPSVRSSSPRRRAGAACSKPPTKHGHLTEIAKASMLLRERFNTTKIQRRPQGGLDAGQEMPALHQVLATSNVKLCASVVRRPAD
jgi:hypothetical protein